MWGVAIMMLRASRLNRMAWNAVSFLLQKNGRENRGREQIRCQCFDSVIGAGRLLIRDQV
jgi:hypothetical protein